MDTQTTGEQIFNSNEAARYLGVSPNSLKTWRSTRIVQIPYAKVGDRVVYRQTDLDRFLDENTVRVTAEA